MTSEATTEGSMNYNLLRIRHGFSRALWALVLLSPGPSPRAESPDQAGAGACARFAGFQMRDTEPPGYPASSPTHKTGGTPDVLEFTWNCPDGTQSYFYYFCCSCEDNTSLGTPALGPGFHRLEGLEPGDYAWKPSCYKPPHMDTRGGPLLVARLGPARPEASHTPVAGAKAEPESSASGVPEPEELEAKLRQMKAESLERADRLKTEYETNPTSERAHVLYLQALIADGKLKEAREVIESLKRLDPENAVAQVASKQVVELEAGGGGRAAGAGLLLSKEMLSAMQKDAFRHTGVDPEFRRLFEAPGKVAVSDLMKTAEDARKPRREKLVARYGDLCKGREDDAGLQRKLKFQSRFTDTLVNRGREGLRKELPAMMTEFGDIPASYIEHAKHLLSEKEYERAAKVVGEGLRKFPGSIELKILSDGMGEVAFARSDEAKEGVGMRIHQDLMELMIVNMGCDSARS